MTRTSLLTVAALSIGGAVGLGAFILRGPLAELSSRPPTPPPTFTANAAELQRTVYKTNSWFSSLYSFPSEPVYMQPGVFKFTTEGVEIGVPGVASRENVVQASFQSWCTIQWPAKLDTATIAHYGDYDVRVKVQSTGQSSPSTLHLVQGSPITMITDGPQELLLRCVGATLSATENGVLISRPETTTRILVQGQTSLVQDQSGQATAQNGQYRILFIPEGVEPSLLSQTPWDVPHGTQVSWQSDPRNNDIITTYSQLTQTPDAHWSVLYPHHQAAIIGTAEIAGTYQTGLGPLQLVRGAQFQTRVAAPELPSTFTAVTNPDAQTAIRAAIRLDAERYLAEEPPPGVYFRGTWLGALTTLTQLADLYHEDALANRLRTKLTDTMMLSSQQFRYDEDLKLYRALNPEFGNEHGNDHHFHYGYYIRAAAYLAERGELPDAVRTTTTSLVQDIATTDRTSSQYPFLRNYSAYEGHSWADGRARFADGNNQESTSEALNAWYSLALWGRVTQDVALAETGTWLFSQELSATKSYWFGIGNPFPAEYGKPMASLVWAGKREFTTWFSPQPGHILGIQYLPLTPASRYLGEIEQQTNMHAKLLALDPNIATHEWFDLLLATLSYSQPDQAVTQLHGDIPSHGLKLSSLLLQVVYENAERK